MANFAVYLLVAVMLCLSASTNAVQVTLAWDPNPEPDLAGYNVWHSSGGGFTKVNAGTNTSVVISNLVEGVTYSFYATAYNTAGLESDPSETIQHHIPLPVFPPVITAHPTNITANTGTQVILSVQATGTVPLVYQWFRDGILVPGAVTPTLSFASVQTTNAGVYFVIVSNSAGSVTSSNATLTVKTVKNAKSGSRKNTLNALALSDTEASGLRLIISGAALMVNATGTPGSNYTLYAADDVSALNWDLIATTRAGEDGSVEFQVNEGLQPSRRFFSVRAE